MLVTCKQTSVRNIWRGRRVRKFHPRVVFVVRKHLSLLHAAVDLNDLQQACGKHLTEIMDESVPFPEPSASAQSQAQSQSELQAPPKSQARIQLEAPDPDTDFNPNPRSTNHYQLRVGYGWTLDFQFLDGEARSVNLECDSDAQFLGRSRDEL